VGRSAAIRKHQVAATRFGLCPLRSALWAPGDEHGDAVATGERRGRSVTENDATAVRQQRAAYGPTLIRDNLERLATPRSYATLGAGGAKLICKVPAPSECGRHTTQSAAAASC
jgi:hypothetical protein